MDPPAGRSFEPSLGADERTVPYESLFLMPYMQVPKKSPRQEYRMKQRALIDASPVIAAKFSCLKSLRVTLEFFDASGITKQGGMKCKLNVEHARSMLWFACPGVECLCGDFDLSEALATAVGARNRAAMGEVRCEGWRHRGVREPQKCGTLLRYKFHLNYD